MPPPLIQGSSTAVAAFVGVSPDGPLDTPVHVGSLSAFEDLFGRAGPLAPAVRLFFANGGREAIVSRAGGVTATSDDDLSEPGLQAQGRGVWALTKAGTFNILCVPPLPPGAGAVSARTRRAALALAREHRAMFLADPSSSWTTADAILDGLASEGWGLPRDPSTAVYVPDVVVVDPESGHELSCPASPAVAGMMARIDRARGVWKAPAGHEASLEGIARLAADLDSHAQALLNPMGINVLRTFPGRDPVVWGARTLAGDEASASEWKYVPVRRLALFLEQSIAGGIQWAESEPNAEPLWADIRRAVSVFLAGLFRAGAFPGRTEREAFFVKCDAQTTTAADIAAGRLVVVIGFAPVRPAEFVLLEFRVRAGAPGEGT